MTSMTSLAGAWTTIDSVDWWAMAQEASWQRACPPAQGLDARLLTRGDLRLDWAPVSAEERTAVREFSVPLKSEVGPDEALTDMLAENVAEHGDEVGFRIRGDGGWQDVTWREFGAQVAGVAKGLVAAGVEAGDRVALQAKTRYEWTVCDYAIWTAGAVVVPVYESSSADQVAWILSDSGAKAAVVESEEHASTMESVRDQVPDLGPVWVMDDDVIGSLSEAGAGV